MDVDIKTDIRLSNGFELRNYHEIFIPKTDFTKIGKWYHNMTIDQCMDMGSWKYSDWSFRLYFSSIN